MSAHTIARSLTLATLSILIAFSVAPAQLAPSNSNPRLIRIGFGGGVIVPRTGASVNTLKTGAQGQGFLLIQLPGGLPAIRANFDYAKMKFDDAGVGGANDADRTQLAGVASLKLDLLRGPVRPYLLAGVGAYNVKDVVRQASSGSASYTDTNVGLDGGAGIAFKLWAIEGFAETRIQNVFTKQQGLVDTKSIQAFPVTFGIVF